jgi:hypothetical protein
MSLMKRGMRDVMAFMSLMKARMPTKDGFLGPAMGLLLVSYMEAAVSDQVLAACAEFPNDNPGLHLGAIWYAADVTGAPAFEAQPTESARELAPQAEPPTDPTPPVIEADDAADDIEIVETLAFDDAIDESPEPPEVPLPEVAVVLDEPVVSTESLAPAALDDPFALLVAVLEDVARAAGADDATTATLLCLLGRTRLDASAPDAQHTLRAQALAWQGILRGESEDFAACGSGMLDEWSAALVAGVLGQNVRADGLKRELRRRGVAAFGLVEQAA